MIVLCMLLQRRQEYKKISAGSKGLPRSTDHDLHPDYFTPDQTMCSLSLRLVNLLRMQVPFVFSYLLEKKVAAAGSECLGYIYIYIYIYIHSCVHILSLSCVVMVGMGSHFYGAKDFQIYILFSLINSCIAATSLSLFKTTLEFPMRSMVHVCK